MLENKGENKKTLMFGLEQPIRDSERRLFAVLAYERYFMFTVAHPGLLHLYQQAARNQPARQVVEPGGGVNGRTTPRPLPVPRKKDDGEGADFQSIFINALSANKS